MRGGAEAFLFILAAAGWIGSARASSAAQQPPEQGRTIVDWNEAELVRAYPELESLRFTFDQDRLQAILRSAGGLLSASLAKFAEVSAVEDLHSMRFQRPGGFDADQHSQFRYVVRAASGGAGIRIDELRTGPRGEAIGTPEGFPLTANFLWCLRYLLPRYRAEARFRYLGLADNAVEVVAFEALSDAAEVRMRVGASNEAVLSQGLFWFDSASSRVVRLRVDLSPGAAGSQFERLTTDVRLGAVWLPSKATVTVGMRGMEFYNVHRFSAYRMGAANDGAAVQEVSGGEADAREVLVNGIVLLRNQKPAEAARVLREAVRLDPESADAHYQLGVALHESNDLAGAEVELRDAVKRAPDVFDGHSQLGKVLFKRGDAAGASAQFREAIRLDAKDAASHANLGEALVKVGDWQGAVEEYRIASELAPENSAVKARYQSLEHAAFATAPPETTIKVDVRQVLVPVVVTDKDGHHVTGLGRADFHVFEDGVEQAISGFLVEHAAGTDPAEVSPSKDAIHAEAARRPATPRRTYTICVDTLHASFGDFARVREALARLMKQEKDETAQYALITLGTQAEVLEQVTPDPAKILAALDRPRFLGAVAGSQANSIRTAMDGFQRDVEATRRACDSPDPLEQMKCRSGKQRLLLQAEVVSEQNRIATIGYLRQLRELVEQLARFPARRTLILISDGFMLSPGRETFGMLAAYFPDLNSAGMRSFERLQSEFDSLVRLAARYNVPIYSIDSRGLYGPSAFDASSHGSASMLPGVMSLADSVARESGDSLAEMAQATGGVFVHNTNDLLAGLERVLADGRDYYTLAYVSKNGVLDGKFRVITVKLRDGKLVVRAKRGYWASAE